MREAIGTLLELQTIHLELDEVRGILNQVPDRLAEINAQRDSATAELQDVEDQCEEHRTEMARLQHEHDEEAERVQNYDKRLKQLKTNREYQALLREIGFARKLVSETESEIGSKKALLAAAAERTAELQSLLDELNNEAKGIEDEWAQSQSDMKAREAELDVAEKAVRKQVRPELIGRYSLIRKRLPVAVVPWQNGRCSGCNMSVPPQLTNRLIRGADLITCSSCSRILFLELEKNEEEDVDTSAA